MQLFDFELMQHETAHAMNAVQAYQAIFLPQLLLFFVMLGALLLIMKPAGRRYSTSFIIFLPLTLAVNLHFFRHPDNSRPVAPTVFSAPILYLKNSFSSRYFGPREEVSVRPAAPGKAQTIVLILDESIRGDILSINGHAAATTPLLERQRMVNFGQAAASTNCSAPSHLVLRTGLKPEQIPDPEYRSFQTSSIFQYARQAGYRTILIDGQRLGGNLQDYLSRYDLAHIDSFEFQKTPALCKDSGDCFLVERIAEAVQGKQPTFVFAVKEGAHVPYQKNYPPGAEVFTPALKPGEGITDYERSLNSYRNAVRWTVDNFFAALLPRLEGRNYLIIYTSDHGQNIDATRITHCSKTNPAPSEGNVPLLVFTGREDVRSELEQNLAVKGTHASHFDIFPTFLRAFGYDRGWVQATFGPSLFDPELWPQRFYAGGILESGHGTWHPLVSR